MPRFRRTQPAPASLGDHINERLTFFGMVGVVMAALKLKDRWDDYRELPADEEGAVRLPASPNTQPRELDDVSMVDTTLPRPRRAKRRACCMCCGVDCTIFWKAIGIVVLLFTLWNSIKLVKWLLTPTPTGLEGLPTFGTSLGCADAPHLFGGAPQTYLIPVSDAASSLTLHLAGAALGTLTVTNGPALTLDLTLRTDSAALLAGVAFDVAPSADGNTATLTTPAVGAGCMRFDATLSVPPALRSLQINAAALTQIQMHPHAHIGLDTLGVSLSTPDSRARVELSAGVQATNLAVKAMRGWVTGDVALVNSTALTTSGDAVTNVHVHPSAPVSDAPAPVYLTTSHGSGRADVFFESDGAYAHRPIVAAHKAGGGELYLTYADAQFSGRVSVAAQSYSMRGVQSEGGLEARGKGWVGDKDGGDSLTVANARGWVGVYF
ncbi:hypothetical protein HWV62_16022 [Athelia sp. TMB]|nr:hypothetical protein HWV62_16022 [Athelia sp. TMB]